MAPATLGTRAPPAPARAPTRSATWSRCALPDISQRAELPLRLLAELRNRAVLLLREGGRHRGQLVDVCAQAVLERASLIVAGGPGMLLLGIAREAEVGEVQRQGARRRHLGEILPIAEARGIEREASAE